MDKNYEVGWRKFVQKCVGQTLDFKKSCKLAQAGYFEYLKASYAALILSRPELEMTDEEWMVENGGVPESVFKKIIAPGAALILTEVVTHG